MKLTASPHTHETNGKPLPAWIIDRRVAYVPMSSRKWKPWTPITKDDMQNTQPVPPSLT